jgi:hypothetical protein
LPIIGFHTIFQEEGYSENSSSSTSLGKQAFKLSCRHKYKFQAWKMKIKTVIHFVLKDVLYFPTPAFIRRLVE